MAPLSSGFSLSSLIHSLLDFRCAQPLIISHPHTSLLFDLPLGFVISPTGNLDSEEGAAERLVEDVFIRRFLHGTFVGLLAQEPVLKRRANVLIICLVLFQNIAPAKIYFLAAYTETLFSHFYKCPVKLEFQTVSSMLVYKYL